MKRSLLLALLLASACHKNQPPPDQNIAIDNDAATPSDVEALPPDESSATPSDELANGSDNPDLNVTNSGNSD